MKIVIVSAVAVTVLLSGCSSIQKASICNEDYRQSLVSWNDRLVERKPVIDGYLNGEPIPWERESALNRTQLETAYASGYNRSLEELQRRAAEFNRLCVVAAK